jgi:hypothetical protein
MQEEVGDVEFDGIFPMKPLSMDRRILAVVFLHVSIKNH